MRRSYGTRYYAYLDIRLKPPRAEGFMQVDVAPARLFSNVFSMIQIQDVDVVMVLVFEAEL